MAGLKLTLPSPFIFNERNEQSPAQFLTFNCPHFETEVVRDKFNGRILKRNYNYECNRTFVGAFILARFIPVCLCVHYNSFNSFHFVGACLAYKIVDNDVFIIKCYSS